jgi:hypothetical protein
MSASKNSDEFFSSSWLERFAKPRQQEGRHKPIFAVLMNHSAIEDFC